MTATLNYDMRDAPAELWDGCRWAVLTMLILHANIRNRCWPTVQYLADKLGKSKPTIIAAIAWLRDHAAITLIDFAERNDKEKSLAVRQHVYQLTGELVFGEKRLSYLYVGRENGQVEGKDSLPSKSKASKRLAAETSKTQTLTNTSIEESTIPTTKDSLSNPPIGVSTVTAQQQINEVLTDAFKEELKTPTLSVPPVFPSPFGQPYLPPRDTSPLSIQHLRAALPGADASPLDHLTALMGMKRIAAHDAAEYYKAGDIVPLAVGHLYVLNVDQIGPAEAVAWIKRLREMLDSPPTPINGNGDTKNIPAAATEAISQKPEVLPKPSTNRAAGNGTSVLPLSPPSGFEYRGIGGQKHLVKADLKTPHPVLVCGAQYDGTIVTGPSFDDLPPCLDCLEKAKPRPPRKRSAWDDTFDALIAGMLGKSTYDLTPADKAAKGGIVGPWLHGKRKDKECGGLLAYEVARTGKPKEALDYAELATAAELFWHWYRRNDKTRALTACATFLSNWADFRDNRPSPKDYEHGTGTTNQSGNAGLLAQGAGQSNSPYAKVKVHGDTL